MKEIIYVRLMNEGTSVYKPVEALKLSHNQYKILETVFYDPDDEEWEFVPGNHVFVEKKSLSEGQFLIAVNLVEQ